MIFKESFKPAHNTFGDIGLWHDIILWCMWPFPMLFISMWHSSVALWLSLKYVLLISFMCNWLVFNCSVSCKRNKRSDDRVPDFYSPRTKVLILCPRSELSEHLDIIDSGLENLHAIFSRQSINFDSSPLFDVSVSLLPSDRMCTVGV